MMSEKRFTLSNFASPSQLSDVCDDGGKMLNSEVVELLNEQQATIKVYEEGLTMKIKKINEQQATIRKLQDLCGKSDGENMKLRIENKKLKAKLREKEEDEKLYANEILELRETNKEHIKFKSLGGDY